MCVYRKTKKPETVSVTFKNEKKLGQCKPSCGIHAAFNVIAYNYLFSQEKN